MFHFEIVDRLTNKVVYECSISKSPKVRERADAVNSGYFMAGMSGVHPDKHCYHRVTSS